MKYYIIAGESSGDLYGSLLIRKLKDKDRKASFRYWGGPRMQEAASGCFKTIKDTSFMGFYEVARQIFKIRQLFIDARRDIKSFQPDILILIDYPGFNLRMARWAKENGFKVAYYISPQIWAWKVHRHKILRRYTDLFFVVLPFEKAFYQNLDTPCIYVGHPLKELISRDLPAIPGRVDLKIIGLFPGSREQEVKKHLPVMVQLIGRYPGTRFLVAAPGHIDESIYNQYLPKDTERIEVIKDASYKVMERCDVAVASSGTTTLELALYGVPQVVIYKTSLLTFEIGKKLVKTPFISLVNLIAEKNVVPELLQNEVTVTNLEQHLNKIMQEDQYQAIVTAYRTISQKLGTGTTSDKVAEHIVSYLSPSETVKH